MTAGSFASCVSQFVVNVYYICDYVPDYNAYKGVHMTKKIPYSDRNGYAYVYVNRKPVAMKAPDGSRCKTGSKEALCAYHRFSLGIGNEPVGDVPNGKPTVTIEELASKYLTYVKARHSDYGNFKTIVNDFLLASFGDEYPVESFTPKCLKKVREAMIESQRFCRNVINLYISRIVTIFSWGVSEELVQETTHRALLTVKRLEEGHPGTRENPPREEVPFDVVVRLVSFLIPILRVMVQIQGLHGMRPGEVCRMRVGEIDRSKEQKTGFWYYIPASHKTQKKTGKKTVFPLGKYEQELLLPYLEGKGRRGGGVFSCPRDERTCRRA